MKAGSKMRKKRKSLTGYILKNWGMVFYKTGIDECLVMHDTVYKKLSPLVQTKVRITIEEV
jgi:hypothetical protein